MYSGANGALLYTFTGEGTNDRFGESVSGAGDVNDDGFADLAVGAPANDSGGNASGRAYVYSGANGALLFMVTGDSADDSLGRSVSGVGDVNNDGFADLIVGASGNDAGGTDAGQAYVYSGVNGALLYTFTGEEAGEEFGISVSGAGDVNNDGFPDLVVGAHANDARGTDAGRAYVFSGANGVLLYTFTGESGLDLFGRSVSDAGDINNDGFADLVVGAYLNDAGGTNVGRAYVFSLADPDSDFIPTSCDNCPNNFNPRQEDIDGDGLGDSCYLPAYQRPLTIVVREVLPQLPVSGGAVVQPGGDAGVNLCVHDPDGLLICADSTSHLDSSIINTIGDDANYYEINGNDSIVIDTPKTGVYLIEIFAEIDDDPQKQWLAEIRIDGTVELITGASLPPEGDGIDTLFVESNPYVEGDADGSGSLNIGDATFLVKYIFQSGEEPPDLAAADADCSGYESLPDVNIGDATFIVKHIFQGGSAPGCPPVSQ